MSSETISNEIFDPKSIINGPRVSLKKCHYRGHAMKLKDPITAIDISIAAIDYIGKKFDSEDCIPFAVLVLKLNEENVCLAEDNGEIGCGDMIASCLNEMQSMSLSCMVCVTRSIDGAFVADMFQGQKHRVVKEAASKAVQKLIQSLHIDNVSLKISNAESFNDSNLNSREFGSIYQDYSDVQVTSRVKQLTLDLGSPIENGNQTKLDSEKAKALKPFK